MELICRRDAPVRSSYADGLRDPISATRTSLISRTEPEELMLRRMDIGAGSGSDWLQWCDTQRSHSCA